MTKPIALALVLVATVAAAQEAAAPVLPADAVLRLDIYTLRAENISLKIAALQRDFAALQAEANAYAKTLQRDGYTLTHTDDGAWRYVEAKK